MPVYSLCKQLDVSKVNPKNKSKSKNDCAHEPEKFQRLVVSVDSYYIYPCPCCIPKRAAHQPALVFSFCKINRNFLYLKLLPHSFYYLLLRISVIRNNMYAARNFICKCAKSGLRI